MIGSPGFQFFARLGISAAGFALLGGMGVHWQSGLLAVLAFGWVFAFGQAAQSVRCACGKPVGGRMFQTRLIGLSADPWKGTCSECGASLWKSPNVARGTK